MHTQEESTNDSIDAYKEFKQLVEEYADEHFMPAVVEEFCKRVYEEHFIFFKPFCNLYYSVYADAMLQYQQSRIDYATFCYEFQELSWKDGRRTPLDGRRLRRYVASMREVVEAYKILLFAAKAQKRG